MKTIIIDVGHGGMWQGFYSTSGKRSPKIPPGFYEGVQVRKIARVLVEMGKDRYKWFAPLLDLSPDNEPDVRLKSRLSIYNKSRPSADLLLSLHTNAKGMGRKWKAAHGAKLFFRGPAAKSARAFLSAYCDTSGLNNRGASKNRLFTILKSVHPSILIEMGFHTNIQDVHTLENAPLIAGALLAGLDSYFQMDSKE